MTLNREGNNFIGYLTTLFSPPTQRPHIPFLVSFFWIISVVLLLAGMLYSYIKVFQWILI